MATNQHLAPVAFARGSRQYVALRSTALIRYCVGQRSSSQIVRSAIEHTPRLALVVGAARSGTTLTRLLLDAHPDIGCPSEAGLPSLMAHLAQAWLVVHADRRASHAQDPGAGDEATAGSRWPLPDEARDWIVRTVQEPMRSYCSDGQRVYCDKSLDSVHHLALVHELFPDARIILVFRHVMDTVASGLEASPWGFNAFGYRSYVQANPGNTVAALASYWLDHVTQALEWQEHNEELCHRVRYEDLVLEPEKTVQHMQAFLGVDPDLSVLSRAFDREALNGPGDYKLEHTTNVHASSVGHGKRVPFTMLPPPLVAALNTKLEDLAYDPLTPSWNAEERTVDGGGQGLWAERLRELMVGIRISGTSSPGPFAAVAEDHQELRWIINLAAASVNQGDGEVEAVLTGTAEDLVLMLTGEENLGVLLRSGRIRHVVADDTEAAERASDREPNTLVAILRRGLISNNRQ